VQVTLEVTKPQYVAHESVLATVTLTNRAGRELLIHSGGTARNPITWLDFAIRDSRGVRLSPARTINFDPVRLPAGQSVARTVDLTTIYRVAELGTYWCYAVVRLPAAGGGTFRSNKVNFNVTQARVVYRQRIGVPNTRNVREFSVLVFNASRKTSLYVRVTDPRSGRTLTTYPLGEALTFHKPQATVDGRNNLHVLYLTSPQTFSHAWVDPNGSLGGRNHFRRGPTGTPRLETRSDGSVLVVGGVPYDPARRERAHARVRRLSERPDIIYRR